MVDRLVLDTSAISHGLRGDSRVWEHVRLIDEIFIPFMVLGEVYYGFYRGRRRLDNIENLNELISLHGCSIIHSSMTTHIHYAGIKDMLRSKGTPIPENDIWIASLCLDIDGTLLTFDEDFLHVSQLKMIFLKQE